MTTEELLSLAGFFHRLQVELTFDETCVRLRAHECEYVREFDRFAQTTYRELLHAHAQCVYLRQLEEAKVYG